MERRPEPRSSNERRSKGFPGILTDIGENVVLVLDRRLNDVQPLQAILGAQIVLSLKGLLLVWVDAQVELNGSLKILYVTSVQRATHQRASRKAAHSIPSY